MTPEGPFSPVYSRLSFLETPGLGGVLRRLDDALGAREPFLIVTGESGTGKTALAHEAVARWGSRVTAAFVAYPRLTGAEFLEEIIRRFGAEPPDGASRSKLVACVEHALADITGRGQVAMLVVDDAHELSLELLEELRLLVNAAQQVRRPLEVLLIGLPTLEARLDEPALVALRQRVSVHAKLEPLSPAEVRRYLHYRVTAIGGDGPGLFSRKTCRDIATRTGGVPRQINALAAEALRVANAWGDPTVGPEHVQTAAAALGGFAGAGETDAANDAGADDSPLAAAPALAKPKAAVVAAPAPAKPNVAEIAPRPRESDAPLSRQPAAPISRESVAPAPREPAAPVPPRPPSPKVAAAIVAPPPAAEIVTPNIPIPAKHDPREWVARFVGEQGPLQISSRATPEPMWEPEPPEAGDDALQDFEEPMLSPRGRRNRSRPRSRSRHGGGLQAATTALLAAIIVAGAIAIVMRVRAPAKSGAGQAAGVATSATGQHDGGKALSTGKDSAPAVRRAAAHTAGEAQQAGEAERRPAAWTTRDRGPYTLDVGEAPDLERAVNQRNRLQRLTGFEGWVASASADGGKPYRIVLGVYRSRERATDAAQMLVNSRTLGNVTVVPLPPPSARL